MNDEKKRKIVRIRIEADQLIVEDIASKISEFLEGDGYEILDQSALYPHRQEPDMARVYLMAR